MALAEARSRSERSFHEKLGHLLLECWFKRNKNLLKKRDEIHRIGLHNRAFLYRR
jgi:ribosomal protein S7